MIEIAREIPDVSFLLALAPEELGAKLLFVMRKRSEDPQQRNMSGNGRMFHFSHIESDLWNNRTLPHPRVKENEVNLALRKLGLGWKLKGFLCPHRRTTTGKMDGVF